MKRVFFTVVALLFLLCGCGAADNYDYLDVPAQSGPFSVYRRGENLEIEKNGVLVGVIEDAGFGYAHESKDGSALSITVNQSKISSDKPKFKGWSLYYCKDELVHIADGVENHQISDNGESVSYETYVYTPEVEDYFNAECDLYFWRGGESTFITKKKVFEASTISPDGKDIYYITGTEKLIDYGEWYQFNDGNPILVAENASWITVSNNAEYIYGTTEDTFYVQKGIDGEKNILFSNEGREGLYNSTYSADYSQVVINTNSGLYISEQGGDPVRLSDPLQAFVPREPEDASFVLPDFEDIKGQIILTESRKLCKINETYEVIELDEDVTQAYLANDGETVIYIIESIRADQYLDSYIAKLNVNSKTEPEVLLDIHEDPTDVFRKEIKDFKISYDGKTVFYAIGDILVAELYTIKNGEQILIESELVAVFDDKKGAVFNNDKYYYTKRDGKILYCYDGETSTAVKEFSGGVWQVWEEGGKLKVRTAEDYKLFSSNDGIEFVRESD
jgi:hypothetical protein